MTNSRGGRSVSRSAWRGIGPTKSAYSVYLAAITKPFSAVCSVGSDFLRSQQPAAATFLVSRIIWCINWIQQRTRWDRQPALFKFHRTDCNKEDWSVRRSCSCRVAKTMNCCCCCCCCCCCMLVSQSPSCTTVTSCVSTELGASNSIYIIYSSPVSNQWDLTVYWCMQHTFPQCAETKQTCTQKNCTYRHHRAYMSGQRAYTVFMNTNYCLISVSTRDPFGSLRPSQRF